MGEPRLVGLGAPTPQEVEGARRIKKLADEDLHSVRKTAEGWRNAEVISASVAFAGGFLAGPEALDKLDDLLRLIVGFALGLVFVVTAFSVGLAVRASVGWPTSVQASTPLALENWENKEVRKVASYIRRSMRLAGLAALVLGVVLSVVLIAPPVGPELSTLETTDGRVYCVSHLREESGNFIVVLSGTEVVVPGDEVIAVQVVDKCPT